jgi:hypothetical protein
MAEEDSLKLVVISALLKRSPFVWDRGSGGGRAGRVENSDTKQSVAHLFTFCQP